MSIVAFQFQAHEVRTVTIDGEPWFVLADLCRVLDIANPSDTASRLDPDALGTTEVIDSMGRKQQARIVNEAGMYEVVFLSRKPDAREFKRWITSDVLPSIRKTGSYGAPDLSTPQGVLAMAEQFTLTAKQLVVAHEQIERDRPLVQQALTYQAGSNMTHRQEFAREVIAWAQSAGYRVLQREVFLFLSKKLGLFIGGERTDAGQATTDALRRGLADTEKGTSPTGHNYATGKLTATGKAYAFERVVRYVEQHGTLELPQAVAS